MVCIEYPDFGSLRDRQANFLLRVSAKILRACNAWGQQCKEAKMGDDLVEKGILAIYIDVMLTLLVCSEKNAE